MTVAIEVSDDVAVSAAQVVGLAGFAAASRIALKALLILPYSEICVLIVSVRDCRSVIGCFSRETSFVTMLSTSRPLPRPVEEMAAIVVAPCDPGHCCRIPSSETQCATGPRVN